MKPDFAKMDADACEKAKATIRETYPEELQKTALILIELIFKSFPMQEDVTNLMVQVAELRAALVKMTLTGLRHEATATLLKAALTRGGIRPN